MAAPRIPVHRLLREARRRKGWTQERLAHQIGATQPAISMFETGSTDALSQEKIYAIAEALDVGRELATLERARRGRPRRWPRLLYCPNPHCLTNVPCDIDGVLRFVPSMVRAAAEQLRCAYCGEILLDRCPHCNAPVVEGAFCTNIECGEPRVSVPQEEQEIDDLREWADAERARRQEIRLATKVANHPLVRGIARGKAGQEEG